MRKIFHKVEFVANVLIILVGILLAVTLIRSTFTSPNSVIATPKNQATIEVGSKISLPDDVIGQHSKTLILALDMRCRFCNESMDFYKRVADSIAGKDIKLIAVFPESVQESASYLESHGISGIDVRQLPLFQLNVRGTPTLILAGRNGQVLNSWVGKLSPNKESEVIDKLTS